jgi:hypothetical protein
MVCLHGLVEISVEDVHGNVFNFQLDDPGKALFFPRHHWIKITLHPKAILMVMASCLLEHDIVEKDYNKFKQLVLS